MSDSTLSTFVANDGDNIAIQDWPLPADVPVRGVVILVHGLGEHAGRYNAVAERLNDWGFAVRGYDQHGHGESGGQPGCIPSDMRLIDDLADIVDSTRVRMDDRTPLILLGHSLGGLVAAGFVSLNRRPVDGLVLSSPAFDTGMSGWQKMMVSVLPRIAPNHCVSNGLDVSHLSHDPAAVAAYRADPRVHDRISGRLARFIAEAGPAVLASASKWRVPTLLMFAGDDRLVDPGGSRAFTAAAPRSLVSSRCFEGYYHEIFNETDPAPVFAELKQWLDARFPA